jgi:hypothetical protein
MTTRRPLPVTPIVDSLLAQNDWTSLPGGELEAPRPRTLCPACRERLKQAAALGAGVPGTELRQKPICFGCYRAELVRERALKAAGQLDTASEARFQGSLPFEPVNHNRLGQLRVRRDAARTAERGGVGQFVDKRRRAQIAARHALQDIAQGLKAHGVAVPERHPCSTAALHAAELQLPDAWIPYVVAAR